MTPAAARTIILRLRDRSVWTCTELLELVRALLVHYDWAEQGQPEQMEMFEQ